MSDTLKFDVLVVTKREIPSPALRFGTDHLEFTLSPPNVKRIGQKGLICKVETASGQIVAMRFKDEATAQRVKAFFDAATSSDTESEH